MGGSCDSQATLPLLEWTLSCHETHRMSFLTRISVCSHGERERDSPHNTMTVMIRSATKVPTI